MNTHHIDLVDYRARSRGNSILYLGTAGSHGNEQLQVTLGEGWEGLTVQVIFHPSEVAVQLPANGMLDIPWEATEKPLTAIQGKIVFQGFNQDRLVNTIDLAYTVARHSSTVGHDEEPYTPGIVEGVLNQMAADKEEILNAAQQADQAKNVVQEALEKVEKAAEKALENIAAAAPALPAVSDANAGQVVAVKSDGTGYQLAGPFLPMEAGICPIVSGNPAVCENGIAWRFQGLKVYGKSFQDSVPGPENPVPIISACAAGLLVLDLTDGADQSKSLSLPIQNGLYGIPAASEGNYTDANGQQWMCDVIDYEAKAKIKNCIQIVLTGNESWSKRGITISDCYQAYFNNFDFNYVGFKVPSICNYFKYDTSNMDTGFYIMGHGYISFAFAPYGTTSANDFKAFLRQKYQEGNPVTVIARTNSPSAVPLSEEQFDAYRSILTYAGTTIIKTVEPVAGIEARYVADGTKYLQSVTDRIASLESEHAGS